MYSCLLPANTGSLIVSKQANYGNVMSLASRFGSNSTALSTYSPFYHKFEVKKDHANPAVMAKSLHTPADLVQIQQHFLLQV